MKSILFSILTFAGAAFAQTGINIQRPDVIETHDTLKNYIVNPSALTTLRGTATSSATLTRDTDAADRLEGVASYSCDASATNGYCEFLTSTIPNEDRIGNCEAKATVKGDLTLYQLELHDGTNRLAISPVLQNYADWTPLQISYPCGQNRRLRLTQTTAGISPAVNIGRLYWGRATNLSQVSQATFAGGMEQAGAANCSYSQNTSTGHNNYITLGAAPSCTQAWTTQGAITSLGPTRHEAVYNNMPPGNYHIALNGTFNTSSIFSCYFRLTDGTNTYQPQIIYSDGGATGGPYLSFHVPYTTAANRTFAIQASDNGTNTCAWQNTTVGGNASWKFYRFPTQAEQAIRLDQTNYDWVAYTPTFSGWSPTGVSCFHKRESTDVLVQCNFTIAGGTASEARLGLPSGLTIDTSRVVSPRQLIGEVISNVNGASMPVIMGEPGQSYVVFGIQNAGSNAWLKAPGNQFSAVISSVKFRVPIQGWQENRGAPLLVGSVTSSSAGAERVERAVVVNTGSACNVTSESGDWLAATGTRNGAGDCTWTINAGIFAADPTCQVTPITTCREASFQAAPSTTSVRTFTSISNGTGTDCTAHLSCQGSRVNP